MGKNFPNGVRRLGKISPFGTFSPFGKSTHNEKSVFHLGFSSDEWGKFCPEYPPTNGENISIIVKFPHVMGKNIYIDLFRPSNC